MEDVDSKVSSLNLDYEKLGYSFIAYIGIYLENDLTEKVLSELEKYLTLLWPI